MDTLPEAVNILASQLPDLKRQRSATPFANDIYEAAEYWHRLGTYVIENNTRVNFPQIALSELELMEQLESLLSIRSSEEQERYAPVFQAAGKLLRFVEEVQPPKDGHLGVLKVIREQFGFLLTDYGFSIAMEEPIGIRFSSGDVYVDLKWAKKYDSSCSFGSESDPKKSFWIDDLLFMNGDEGYRALPQDLALNTESDVENWFRSLADVFKKYGHDVLSNRPGIFEELAKAQTQRDQEYTQEMNRRYGPRSV